MSATHYDALGVTRAATPTLIRAAYKARIRDTHPDNGGDPREAAAVNHAFEVLSDETSRAEYDAELDAAQRQGTAPPDPQPPFTGEPQPAPLADPQPAPGPVDPEVTAAAAAFSKLPLLWLLCIVPWIVACVFVIPAAIGQPQMPGLESLGDVLGIISVVVSLVFWALLAASIHKPAIVVGLVAFLGLGMAGGGMWINLLLVTGLLAAFGVRMLRRRRVIDNAALMMARFITVSEQPNTGAWFITASEPNGQTTLVALSDASGSGMPDTSATLWGRYTAGQYVACDLTQAPAIVHGAITSRTVTLARKAQRRQQRGSAARV